MKTTLVLAVVSLFGCGSVTPVDEPTCKNPPCEDSTGVGGQMTSGAGGVSAMGGSTGSGGMAGAIGAGGQAGMSTSGVGGVSGTGVGGQAGVSVTGSGGSAGSQVGCTSNYGFEQGVDYGIVQSHDCYFGDPSGVNGCYTGLKSLGLTTSPTECGHYAFVASMAGSFTEITDNGGLIYVPMNGTALTGKKISFYLRASVPQFFSATVFFVNRNKQIIGVPMMMNTQVESTWWMEYYTESTTVDRYWVPNGAVYLAFKFTFQVSLPNQGVIWLDELNVY